jgi:hypothetical protein
MLFSHHITCKAEEDLMSEAEAKIIELLTSIHKKLSTIGERVDWFVTREQVRAEHDLKNIEALIAKTGPKISQ